MKQKVAGLCYELAVKLHQDEKFAEAMNYCQEAVQNDAQNATVYVVLGNLYVRTNDMKAAAGCYETALKLNPDQFEARENLKRIRSLY